MDIETLVRCVQTLADAVAVSAGANADLRHRSLAVRNLLWEAEKKALGEAEAHAAWKTHIAQIKSSDCRCHQPKGEN